MSAATSIRAEAQSGNALQLMMRFRIIDFKLWLTKILSFVIERPQEE